jgi:hypothetical protein
MYGYGYSLYNRLAFLGGLDPDASAFLTATGITDPTIQGAVFSLVDDLKKYGVWSKMKAIYPFVGGTATTHKFNLKDSRDLDAAFRLAFIGGWTHSSNGALPNGTNGYANTFLTPSTSLALGSHSFGMYSRTTDVSGTKIYGVSSIIGGENIFLQNNLSNRAFTSGQVATQFIYSSVGTLGLLLGTRTSTSLFKGFRNNILLGSTSVTATNISNSRFYFGARNDNNVSVSSYNSYQHAFGFLGDGLTDEDSANLYYSVQKFQTTLGRSIGTQVVSDADAQAFVTNANIQDQVQATAINNLVIGMKADGVWTKMKAVYPFVGGTATSHKFNLKNPLDTDVAFRLAFSGGWTHDSNGVTPNGVNAFANTYFFPRISLTIGSNSQGQYQRLNAIDSGFRGVWDNITAYKLEICTNSVSFGNNCRTTANGADLNPAAIADTTGLILSKSQGGEFKFLRNSSIIASTTAGSTIYPIRTYHIGALNNNGTITSYSNMPISFSFLGDGLTDTEASNLYTRVQAFQTTLNRQV